MKLNRWLPLAPLVAVVCYGWAGAQSDAATARKRLVSGTVPPPRFSNVERAAFFENAADQLGREPAVLAVTPGDTNSSSSTAAAINGANWATKIDGESLESEIKTLAKLVEAAVKSPNDFKGGGFKAARRDYSTLAALFGMISEYDGDARWKDQAAALRDALGRAGKNCKVGTDGTFSEAKRRSDELAGLIRGDAPQLDASSTEQVRSESADRPPLMERLEIARTERLKPWTGGKGEFTAHQTEVAHEAAIVAALAEWIKDPGYDYAEDAGYLQYVNELQQAALEARDAAKKGDFDRAQAAVGRMGQSCDSCHGDYR